MADAGVTVNCCFGGTIYCPPRELSVVALAIPIVFLVCLCICAATIRGRPYSLEGERRILRHPRWFAWVCSVCFLVGLACSYGHAYCVLEDLTIRGSGGVVGDFDRTMLRDILTCVALGGIILTFGLVQLGVFRAAVRTWRGRAPKAP